MSDEELRDRFPAPPDVDWLPMCVSIGIADDMTPEQLEAAKAGGALMLSKDELLSEWRERYLADQARYLTRRRADRGVRRASRLIRSRKNAFSRDCWRSRAALRKEGIRR